MRALDGKLPTVAHDALRLEVPLLMFMMLACGDGLAHDALRADAHDACLLWRPWDRKVPADTHDALCLGIPCADAHDACLQWGPWTASSLVILMMRSVWGSPVLMVLMLACCAALGLQAPW